jgi:hypothetical protein
MRVNLHVWHARNVLSVDVTPFNAAAAAADVDVGNFSISGRIINVKTMTAKNKRVLNKNGSNVGCERVKKVR